MTTGNVPDNYKSPILRRWRVMEVVSLDGKRSRHVWGHDVANDAGRASSSIRHFNLEEMTATTDSGRTYRLAGAPGKARSGEKAWKTWCALNGVASSRDVTAEYFDPGHIFIEHNDLDQHAS